MVAVRECEDAVVVEVDGEFAEQVIDEFNGVIASLINNGGSYVRRIQVAPPLIQYQTRFEIRQLVFSPGEYPALRSMYEKMATSQTEQVVIKP